MSTKTPVKPDTERYTGSPGDDERFAHIHHREGGGANAAVTESRVTGVPIEALCGKVFVPQRDPERFPICPDCVRVARERGLLR